MQSCCGKEQEHENEGAAAVNTSDAIFYRRPENPVPAGPSEIKHPSFLLHRSPVYTEITHKHCSLTLLAMI